ncbi:alcohol oxidase-like protein [Cubamyces sp. BRFM 1775]|nr:alcohol oxidase-like protein [Cubamyces sp. BRFM 1775]
MSQATFDVVVAGGGTAGCVLAGRLAAADPTLTILVIESGPTTRDDPMHIQPAWYIQHLRPDSKTVKFHSGKESAALGGRSPIVPCGQCLGGGSSVNFTMYTRAAPSDYDDWATVYGNKGWSAAELLPLLQKCETYQARPRQATHGYEGPLKVSYGGFFTEAAQEFLNVAAQYDKTRGHTDDVNDFFECNKYGRWPKWIDGETGTRSDVPHYYIYPQNSNRNLTILTGYHVKRIIFSGTVASGVEYVPNGRVRDDVVPQVVIARARCMVVLSAGTFGSPIILERSGIGSPQVLERIGVMEIVRLQGVGENFQDHQLLTPQYLAADSTHTLDFIIEDDQREIAAWTKQWLGNGTGLLAANGLDAGIRLRPSRRELDAIGDEFRQKWLDFYAPSPDKPVLWMGAMTLLAGERPPTPGRKYFCIASYLQNPSSVGYVHATSADDVEAPLDFHPGYLDSPADMALHKWAYKRTREFARRLPSYRGELATHHPAFPSGSAVAARERSGPVPILEPDLEYSAEDDKALEGYIRQTVSTCWHCLGTCAMKRREEGGVVDSRLNVYGVEGLKIADLSICPGNVAANTYSTAVLIGEKAAMIIAEELGIPMDGAGPVFKARL